MKRRASSAIATGALIACSVCHVWTWLQVLRSFANQGDELDYTGPGLACFVLYMAAVCLFNWFAPGSDSRIYRRVALMATVLHLAAAVTQAAAEKMAAMFAGIASVPNLPMNSAQAMERPDSLILWWIILFFALNLVVVLWRVRCVSEKL